MSHLYGAVSKSSALNRKLSDNVEIPKNYPNLTPNGTLVKKTDLLASVQNLPAVLTDPRKGNKFQSILSKLQSLLL